MNLHIDNDTCHEIIFTQGGVSHSLDKLYYNEKMRKTDILIEQCDRADTLDYDTFDTAQKINLVRQTIEKIIISKPDRNHARTEVTPKVGTFTYIFEMDVYRKTTTMTSKMQK